MKNTYTQQLLESVELAADCLDNGDTQTANTRLLIVIAEALISIAETLNNIHEPA